MEAFYHPYLENWVRSHATLGSFASASVNELYTIKVSHAFWALRNGTWNKHMSDIIFYQHQGAVLDMELYDLLYRTWVEVHGAKKANLNVPASEFFTNTVTRIYDHDSIHASVAYSDEPMFEKILRDGSEVAVDRAKFDALSLEDKFRLVREEVYATALERIVIPSEYTKSPRAAYAWALRQTITSFSKGWFPLFIVENYQHLYKPDIDYVRKHQDNMDKLILLETT